MVISGISSCVKNISAVRSTAEARVMSFGSSFSFAPGTTTILFCPSSPILINATPDEPLTVPTAFTFTPALRNAPLSAEPNESSPTLPTMLTGYPSLATPTAWLAPFPPGKVEKLRPVRVSPGNGTRSAFPTRSKFMLPTTTMSLRTRSHPFRGDGRGEQKYAQKNIRRDDWRNNHWNARKYIPPDGEKISHSPARFLSLFLCVVCVRRNFSRRRSVNILEISGHQDHADDPPCQSNLQSVGPRFRVAYRQ